MHCDHVVDSRYSGRDQSKRPEGSDPRINGSARGTPQRNSISSINATSPGRAGTVEHNGTRNGSFGSDVRGYDGYDSPAKSGNRRRSSTGIVLQIDESVSLDDFVLKAMPTKKDRVAEVVSRLNAVGCEDMDDFKVSIGDTVLAPLAFSSVGVMADRGMRFHEHMQIVAEQYSTHEELVLWLEQKASIQPVLAIRLARSISSYD